MTEFGQGRILFCGSPTAVLRRALRPSVGLQMPSLSTSGTGREVGVGQGEQSSGTVLVVIPKTSFSRDSQTFP